MPDFACHAREVGGRQCRHPAWGQTCYCHWHNAAMYWRELAMMFRPQKRSAQWVYYDPGMITTWGPPRFFSTALVTFWVIILPLSAGVRWLLQFPPPPGNTQLDLFINTLSYAALLPIVAMALGNSSRQLAQLFLAVASGVVVATGYRWLYTDDPVWAVKHLAPVIGAVGFFVVALPPPLGPIVNARADVFDPSRRPPRNLGNSLVKGLAWILIVSAGVAPLLFSGSAPQTPPSEAGSPTERVSAPTPKSEADAQPPDAADAQPPPPQGGTLFNLHSPVTAGLILFGVTVIFANLGSFRSIRPEWHAQTIYHRCVMPAVMRVCAPPELVGTLAGLGLFYALTRFVLAPAFVGVVAGAVVAATCAFFGAWHRGSRVYAANVERLTGSASTTARF